MAVLLNRKERDRQLRKSDILTAAERIFALRGFYQATMQDIAKEAQYAIGTVYLYFKDKDSLYLSLLDEKLRDLFFIIEEEVKKVHDAEDKLKVFIRESLIFFEKNQDFFRIFLLEKSKGQAIKDAKFSSSTLVAQHMEFITGIVKMGQEQKIVRSDFNAGQMADILISIIMTVVFDWLKEPKDAKNLADTSRFILDMFMSGAEKKK